MTDQPETCCGEHKPENKGKPFGLACQLCSKSPTYADCLKVAAGKPLEASVGAE
jgi:hypothetical protein